MPEYWVANYFAHVRFPEVGQKQKTEKERAKVGENNGQATHGARKPPGPKYTWGKTKLVLIVNITSDCIQAPLKTTYYSNNVELKKDTEYWSNLIMIFI